MFRYVAINGVVPDLALILVVVAAIDRGPQFGALLGFGAGLLLDLAPPADHVAGRWALALVVVGYLAGRVRQDARSSTLTAVLVVGAASFVGTSLYAFSGVGARRRRAAGRPDAADHRDQRAVGRPARAAAGAGPAVDPRRPAAGSRARGPTAGAGVLMAAVLIRPSQHRSRLRLFVVQVLFVSLFVTLFARLWYLQVFTGEEYQAKAAEQSVRDLVVQPARGLIVDAMGRPLVANRSSWVVSLDRTVLGRMDAADREALLRKVAGAVHEPYADVVARTRLCGTAGRGRRHLLERVAATSRCRSPATSPSRPRSRSPSRPRTSRAWSPSRRASAPIPRPSASTRPACSAT